MRVFHEDLYECSVRDNSRYETIRLELLREGRQMEDAGKEKSLSERLEYYVTLGSLGLKVIALIVR